MSTFLGYELDFIGNLKIGYTSIDGEDGKMLYQFRRSIHRMDKKTKHNEKVSLNIQKMNEEYKIVFKQYKKSEEKKRKLIEEIKSNEFIEPPKKKRKVNKETQCDPWPGIKLLI